MNCKLTPCATSVEGTSVTTVCDDATTVPATGGPTFLDPKVLAIAGVPVAFEFCSSNTLRNDWPLWPRDPAPSARQTNVEGPPESTHAAVAGDGCGVAPVGVAATAAIGVDGSVAGAMMPEEPPEHAPVARMLPTDVTAIKRRCMAAPRVCDLRARRVLDDASRRTTPGRPERDRLRSRELEQLRDRVAFEKSR
ncbi:MAG: hypothetical protein NVSMB59_13450 [Vulcanimicrobiaceae bacterium]